MCFAMRNSAGAVRGSRSACLAMLALLLGACAGPSSNPQRADAFRRYTPPDPVAFDAEIESLRQELEQARSRPPSLETVRMAADLGDMLTSSRREAEARALLVRTLEEARPYGMSEPLGWTLLNLATANQYLGRRSEAKPQFDNALAVARKLRSSELEHYVLHHRGRFRAEDHDLAGARADFDRALKIRRELGDAYRVASTMTALEALDALQRER